MKRGLPGCVEVAGHWNRGIAWCHVAAVSEVSDFSCCLTFKNIRLHSLGVHKTGISWIEGAVHGPIAANSGESEML